MNRAALHRWRASTPDGNARWLKYSWGPVTSNTLALRLADGSWLVVSPASHAPPSVLDELAKDGEPSALLAPNAFHHLGQEAWRARFPGATSFAPAGALARLAKKSPHVPYRSSEELRGLLPPSIELVLPAGQKTPDMLVRAEVEDQTVWWMGDQFSNLSPDDQVWLLRLIAPLHDFVVGSGLGYRKNGRPELVYVNDRAAWIGSVRAAIERHPPSIVIPAHGDSVLQDTAKKTLALVESAMTPR